MSTTEKPKPKRTKPNDAWTEYVTPWVEETAVPFTYVVGSRSTAVPHTVDLTQRGGHGCCTCTHFRLVANVNWRRTGNLIPYAPKRNGVTECAHIRACWDHYHLNVTVPMMHRMRNGITPEAAP